VTENDISKVFESDTNVLESSAFKDFLLLLLKGISIFANRARIASCVNATVDRFVAESLSLLTGESSLDLDGFQRLVERAVAVRANAAEMYDRACVQNALKKEELPSPAAMEFFLDKKTLAAQALGLSAKKMSRDQQDFYWESVCTDRLAAIGGIVAREGTASDKEYDVSGFIHKALDYLSRDLSSVELLAMADQLETARIKIVNALIAGDTLVDIPAPRITLSDIK
jgi:hypothetical protein